MKKFQFLKNEKTKNEKFKKMTTVNFLVNCILVTTKNTAN